jgi:hypothetical protein
MLACGKLVPAATLMLASTAMAQKQALAESVKGCPSGALALDHRFRSGGLVRLPRPNRRQALEMDLT